MPSKKEIIASEEDVIRMLDIACSAPKEKILPLHRLMEKYVVDVYTKSGISKLSISPNTIIEIKNRLLPDTLYKVIQFSKNLTSKYKFLIIIIDGKKPSDTYGVNIMTFRELKAALGNAAKKTTTNATQKYSLIQRASADFYNGRNALILGAGVSKNAGLPLWENLLEDIYYSIKSEKDVDDFNALSCPCGYSSIIKAQYLSEISSSKLSMVIKERLREKKHSIDKPLFLSIANMIRTGKVHEVLTFNYDDLLEDALDKYLGTPEKYYTVYDNNQEPHNEMPIYHLHGYVPINVKRDKILPTPIISEKDYHQLYKHSFHWSNITLLHALNTSTCFFVGLSMLDPNMRRILDFYSEEQKNGKNQINNRHYVLLRKETLKNATKMQNDKHWKITERMFRKWNIRVLWFNEFKDLPDKLDKIVNTFPVLKNNI